MAETPKYRFLDRHEPPLPGGRYSVTVTQTVTVDKPDGSREEVTLPPAEASFRVGGARVVLPPGAVESRFPPARGSGEYEGVLPHVVLSRGTLPWERSGGRDAAMPWVAVVLVHQDDASRIRESEQSATDLFDSTRAPSFPGLGERWDGVTCRVLDIQRGLLGSLLPDAATVSKHAYALQQDADDSICAVVFGGVAASTGRYTAYLVSTEGRYVDGAFDVGEGGDERSLVRLVVLDRWEFISTPGATDTNERLQALESDANQSLALAIPTEGLSGAGVALVESGHAPLKHVLRDGGETWSWYRGPFVPGRGTDGPSGIGDLVESADALLLRDKNSAMLFTGYAAAWELGRHLALSNLELALCIAKWRTQSRRQAAGGPVAHLAESARAWFERLSALENVPFGYLVPDPRMLPMESIRVFGFDRGWIRALHAGALHVGARQTSDVEFERPLLEGLTATLPRGTGCLIRSEVVEHWPDLNVVGVGAEIIRRDSLSPDVLLVLFDRVVTRIEVFPTPRGLRHEVPDDVSMEELLRRNAAELGARLVGESAPKRTIELK